MAEPPVIGAIPPHPSAPGVAHGEGATRQGAPGGARRLRHRITGRPAAWPTARLDGHPGQREFLADLVVVAVAPADREDENAAPATRRRSAA
ncbi:hypothetical protein C1701_18105 [Actinoalloteichus sp. AHMU CJ021]|nr:hypothetical protein C1701_18105 [Actinoalloteichus sp. AHMU CJ021]